MTAEPESLTKYQFEVQNPDEVMRTRLVSSLFPPSELSDVAARGYALFTSLLDNPTIEAFRAVVDAQRERRYGDSRAATYRSGRFGGQYLRDLHDWDLRAWHLLADLPLVDTVRSLIGPRIVMRAYSARITFRDSGDSTVWHCDQRNNSEPRSPWSVSSPSVTVLVYLDDSYEPCGVTEVVPGSHLSGILPDELGDYPGALMVEADAGDALIFHGALWHRATPNGAQGWTRRVLNLQFAPSWTKLPAFEGEQESPAWLPIADEARASGRTDVLELLGLGGYM